MTKPKGHKGQKRRAKVVKSKKALAPGILETWEDFNEDAMREYLETVAEDFNEQLDSLEEALRGEN